MTDLPEGWEEYDPNQHERSDVPAYKAARAAAHERAVRRRSAHAAALAALRRARSLTQVNLAERLEVAQGEVSRIEHQTDLLLSTLIKYIDGMEGELSLLVRFRDGQTVELSPILDQLLAEDSGSAEVVPPDSQSAMEFASFIGRLPFKEAQFRAVVAA